MVVFVSTGIPELDALIGGVDQGLPHWCPGYPLGHLVEILVDGEDHAAVFERLREASEVPWRVHPDLVGRRAYEGFWGAVTASEEGLAVEAVYDMGAGLDWNDRYQLWSDLGPELNAVLRERGRACVVGFSIRGQDTKPERYHSSLRMAVERLEGGIRFDVLKSAVSGAAGGSARISW